MRSSVGFYSFPKSGNTWIRNIVANFFSIEKSDYQKYLTDIHRGVQESSPTFFNGHEYYFFKSHGNTVFEKLSKMNQCQKQFSLVIIRNPLDVFLSYMNFISNNANGSALIPFDSVEDASSQGLLAHYFSHFLISGTVQPDFFKTTSSWYEHTKFWISQEKSDDSCVIVKYEDMINGDFTKIGKFFSLIGVDEGKIQDCAKSFKQDSNGKFYWKMKSYYFSEYLEKEQIETFIYYHGDLLKKLGYYADYLEIMDAI